MKAGDYLADMGLYGKIILEWILGKCVGRCGLDAAGSGQGQVVGSCEQGSGPSDSIKGGEFLV